jgi:hypothetical protein
VDDMTDASIAGEDRPGGFHDDAADLEPADGGAIDLANEFAAVRVRRVETRNGTRLLIESTRTGREVSLCPLELEALTWQTPATFSAMLAHPFEPLPVEPA